MRTLTVVNTMIQISPSQPSTHLYSNEVVVKASNFPDLIREAKKWVDQMGWFVRGYSLKDRCIEVGTKIGTEGVVLSCEFNYKNEMSEPQGKLIEKTFWP